MKTLYGIYLKKQHIYNHQQKNNVTQYITVHSIELSLAENTIAYSILFVINFINKIRLQTIQSAAAAVYNTLYHNVCI